MAENASVRFLIMSMGSPSSPSSITNPSTSSSMRLHMDTERAAEAEFAPRNIQKPPGNSLSSIDSSRFFPPCASRIIPCIHSIAARDLSILDLTCLRANSTVGNIVRQGRGFLCAVYSKKLLPSPSVAPICVGLTTTMFFTGDLGLKHISGSCIYGVRFTL